MLDLVQTVALIVSVLIAALALWRTERDRQRSLQRARLERVLNAVLELQESAIRALEIQGEGARVEVARANLRAALAVAATPFDRSEILSRQTEPTSIKDQSEAAIIELAKAIDEIAS